MASKTPAPQTSDQQAAGETTDVTVKDMKLLLALLLDDTINDKDKLPYKKAKDIVDIIFSPSRDPPSQEEEESTGANESTTESVIAKNDDVRMKDLGLGRGVDATKMNPWQCKSSFQVRKIDKECKNIVGTEESGQREFYEDEVKSTVTQQLNTKLSIKEPSKSLTIGIDAEGARSFVESRKVVGERIKTRTVAFNTTTDIQSSCDNSFEDQMSEWIMDRIETWWEWQKRDKSKLPPKQAEVKKDADGKTVTVQVKALERLKEFVKNEKEKSPEMRLILQYCYDFIEHLGITHYVHTVKLGAARYKVLTTEDYYIKVEGQTGFELNKVAKVELKSGGGFNSRVQRTTTKVNEIGKIDTKKNTVAWKSPDEAVLEIELKPLYSVIHTRALQLATKWALERYVWRREGRREGPFIIACGSEDSPIYWRVMNGAVHGTKLIKDSSLFYVLETDSGRHPQEFYIGYVGDDMAALEQPRGPANPASKIKDLAPTPKYVTAELSTLGSSAGPLRVSAGAYRNHARFTLHSSVIRYWRVMRSSVDMDRWAEGGGYFINCARRRFKPDGYIAMTRREQPAGQSGNGIELEERNGEQTIPTHSTKCVTSADSHNESNGPWMVFRLLPGEHKKLKEDKKVDEDQKLEEDKIVEEVEENKKRDEMPQKKKGDRKPQTKRKFNQHNTLVDYGSDPTYRSDERDFEFLYGDPSTFSMTDQQ